MAFSQFTWTFGVKKQQLETLFSLKCLEHQHTKAAVFKGSQISTDAQISKNSIFQACIASKYCQSHLNMHAVQK